MRSNLLSCLQRRSQKVPTVLLEQPGQLGARRDPLQFCGRSEEGLHLSSGLERDEHSAATFTGVRPDMGDSTWREDGVTTAEFEPYVAHL